MSGVSGDGVPEAMAALLKIIRKARKAEADRFPRQGSGVMSQTVASSRRLIVKIGSSLLVDESTGEIKRPWLDALARGRVACRKRGQEVLIVSSGAIAVGRRPLGLAAGALRLEEKQAAAATGQIRLAHAYQEALAARHGVTVAQILLTPDDTEERRRHLNARATFEAIAGAEARCRSSTRTTRWPPPKSVSATMTGSPRGWRR